MLDPNPGGSGWDCGFGSGTYIYATEGNKVVRIDVGAFDWGATSYPNAVTQLDTSALGLSHQGAACAHDQDYGYIRYRPYYEEKGNMIRFALGSSSPFVASLVDPTSAPASRLLGTLKEDLSAKNTFDGRPLPISTSTSSTDYGYILRRVSPCCVRSFTKCTSDRVACLRFQFHVLHSMGRLGAR